MNSEVLIRVFLKMSNQMLNDLGNVIELIKIKNIIHIR